MKFGYIKINLTKIAIMLFTLKALLDSQHPNILTAPAVFDAFCIGFGVAVFLLKLIPYRFTIKSFALFLGSTLFILFTCYQIKQYSLLISYIAIFLLRDENLDEYISLMLKGQIIMMIAVFCAISVYYFGYFDYLYWFRSYNRVSFMACMSHPNVFAAYILSTLLMYGWVNFDTMNTLKYILMILVACVSYVLTDTRTTFILSIFFIIFLYLGRSKYMQKWYKKYLKFVFPVLSVMLLYFITHYANANSVILFLDELLSGRIKLGAYAYTRSGIAIFPRMLDYAQSGVVQWEMEWGLNAFTFDSIYSFIWIQLGVLWLIFISIIIFYLIKKTDYKCHLFILMWIIYGFTEVHGLNAFRFFPLLLVVLVFQNKEKIEEY